MIALDDDGGAPVDLVARGRVLVAALCAWVGDGHHPRHLVADLGNEDVTALAGALASTEQMQLVLRAAESGGDFHAEAALAAADANGDPAVSAVVVDGHMAAAAAICPWVYADTPTPRPVNAEWLFA